MKKNRLPGKNTFDPSIRTCAQLLVFTCCILIFFSAPALAEDAYEDDDTLETAKVIFKNDDPCIHNFHDAGDADWKKFYALSSVNYKIEVTSPGTRCDAVINLYDANGTKILDEIDDTGKGEPEETEWTPDMEGVYYIRINNYDEDDTGENTSYAVSISPTSADDSGIVEGSVKNEKGIGVSSALIKTHSGDAAEISREDGYYRMSAPPSQYTIIADAEGYRQKQVEGVDVKTASVTNVDITLTREYPPGDLNHDAETDLKDAVYALKISAGEKTFAQTIYPDADINEDKVLGIPEAIHALQKAAGL